MAKKAGVEPAFLGLMYGDGAAATELVDESGDVGVFVPVPEPGDDWPDGASRAVALIGIPRVSVVPFIIGQDA